MTSASRRKYSATKEQVNCCVGTAVQLPYQPLVTYDFCPSELGESLIGEIVEEITALNCNLLIGVDTGGDSLFEDPLTGSEGRDKQMLRILQSVDLPLLHVVFAPGSDGETPYGQMQSCFAKKQRLGEY